MISQKKILSSELAFERLTQLDFCIKLLPKLPGTKNINFFWEKNVYKATNPSYIYQKIDIEINATLIYSYFRVKIFFKKALNDFKILSKNSTNKKIHMRKNLLLDSA